MKFGLFQMTPAPVGSNHADIYRDFIEMALEAERLGYWSIWTTEHHFQADKSYAPFDATREEYPVPAEYDISPDPLTLLSFVAARTSTIRLGTAVLVLAWDHPVRSAERAAMLDQLSGGRVELGLGRGGPEPYVAEAFGVPTEPAEALRKYQEAVEIFLRAWRGEKLSGPSEFFTLPPGRAIVPAPAQADPPVWMGSASDASAVWAAEHGLPYATIAWPLTLMEEYKRKRAVYLEAAQKAETTVGTEDNVVLLYCYCGESDEEAREVAYEHIRQFQYVNEQHYEIFQGERGAQLMSAMGYTSLDTWVHDQAMYTLDNHIIGSVDTVIERLKYHEDEIGLRYVLLNQGFGLMPQQKAFASMRRIAEHVMPHFNKPGEPALSVAR